MVQIDDGKGRGWKAEVNGENELVVRAITEAEIEHASITGKAYAWDSTELDIDAGDTMLFVKNMNEIFSTSVAEAVAFSDETAVADATVLTRIKTPVDGRLSIDLTGVILGKNHYIQINQETESTSGSVILCGHYANPS